MPSLAYLRTYAKGSQTGAKTGATFSGMQDIIRHSNEIEATIQTGYTQCFNLVCYNPTNHGTPSLLTALLLKFLQIISRMKVLVLTILVLILQSSKLILLKIIHAIRA